MKLDEIMDKSVPYEIEHESEDGWSTAFKIGGREINLHITRREGSEEPDTFEIEFNQMYKKLFQTARGAEERTVQSYKKTGSGNEFVVFSTVAKIVKDFIRKMKPKAFVFDGDKEENRGPIYTKLVKRVIPAGWKMERDDETSPMYSQFRIVKEVFEPKDHGGKEQVTNAGDFEVSKKIGDYTISFHALQNGLTNNKWEVHFTAVDAKGKASWDPTGAGDEVAVFSFVINAMRKFVDKFKPSRVQFSSEQKAESRTKLYQRLVKRFGDDYIAREFKTGMGSAPRQVTFDLIKKPTTEGQMKRSDPYVSGEKEDVGRRDAPTPAKKSPLDAQVRIIAQKSGRSEEEVRRVRDQIKREIDLKMPSAWALVNGRLKKHFGL